MNDKLKMKTSFKRNLVDYKMFHEISAGGVVFKKLNGKIYFAVIERAARQDQTLPKGHQKIKETLQQTAKREVFEETGFHANILEYLGKFTYKVKDNNHKIISFRTVHWFLMEYLSGPKRKQNKEIKDVRWLTPGATLKFLSYYNNDRRMVKKALKIVRSDKT